MCVSEGVGGREGGRGGGGPDTELKTKTPHVNVGNDFLWANTLSNFVVAIRIAMAIWEVVGGVLVRLQKDRLEG